MQEIDVDELANDFEVWADRVAAGEAFIITKNGRPHCRLVPVSRLTGVLEGAGHLNIEASEALDAEIHALFEASEIFPKERD
ncbi:type II toxin-antitoxin system prevent-host-death family antitoxin [Pseudomonas sp.]|uniref:type II toxin-antitoxin system Phd/YefM family antitoxin n=1 Tax=Pseudomonas sp. TaxID=306 RepID=UPI0028AB752C|nr:type II toxin-antitoxin system prevent-host-death family antitoxin [Pseudomonas sp.]